MQYPWWYVPYLTSPMLIAIIATLHVIVSHYAVGGGIILARENSYGHKTSDSNYREYWQKHVRFFVLLTVVYGAVTGVGIWWTIGLASPLATEVLIRTFVFGWAIEWVFFIIEVVAAFGFYYFWDRLPPKVHSRMGWTYALAAWISLVLISAITAFMLNVRSLFGPEGLDPLGSFWHSFMNVQFLPQTVARTGGSLVLATFYVYLHVSLTNTADTIREQVVRRMRVPSVIGILLMAVAIPFWFIYLPESSVMLLERAAAITTFAALFAAILAAVLILVWVGPFRAPEKMGVALALALFFLGVAAVGTGEFIREAVRKPFIIDQIVYANQIMPEQIESVRARGILESGVWTRMELQRMQEKYPNVPLLTQTALQKESSSLTKNVQNIKLNNSDKERKTNEPVQLVGYTGPKPTVGDIVPVNSESSDPLKNNPQSHTKSDKINSRADLPNGQNDTILVAQNQTSSFTPASTVPNTSASAGAGQPDLMKLDSEQMPPLPPKKRTMLARELRLSENSIGQGNGNLLKLEEIDQLKLGRMVFLHHCNDCHAADRGYSAVGPMLTGKSLEEIRYFVIHLNRPAYFMPPWCGTYVEAELLAKYLVSIRAELPDNIIPRPKKKSAPLPSDANTPPLPSEPIPSSGSDK